MKKGVVVAYPNLESCYLLATTSDILDGDDKASIQEALTEHGDWLSANQDAEKDDFEEHMKDLQRVCDPIVGKVYQRSGGQGGSGDNYDDEEFEDL